MLIKNVYIENSEELTDIRINDGKIQKISKGQAPQAGVSGTGPSIDFFQKSG